MFPANITGDAPLVLGQIIVDGKNGHDGEGTRYGRAVKSLVRAREISRPGDCILVAACEDAYTVAADEQLLEDEVNWFFLPGARVEKTFSNTGTLYGIFDDRASGPVTCQVLGAGEFTFSTGLNGYFSGTVDATANPPNVATIRGLFVITNASSFVKFQAKKLTVESIMSATIAGVSVTNATRVELDIDEINDPQKAVAAPGVQYALDDLGDPLYAMSSVQGVYWEIGEVFGRVGIITTGLNAIWAEEPTGNVTPANLYLRGQYYRTYGSQSCVYHLGEAGSTIYKTWVDCQEIYSDVSAGIACYGGGKMYVDCMKARGAYAVNVNGGTLWLTAQKLTASQIPISNSGGESHIKVHQIEDEGTVTVGISTTGGTHVISGSLMKILNGKGVSHGGGSLKITGGMTIDTSTTSAAGNNPVTISASGLILFNVGLVAPAAADSIYAATPQSIKVYNTFMNRAKNANVTLVGSSNYVDANFT